AAPAPTPTTIRTRRRRRRRGRAPKRAAPATTPTPPFERRRGRRRGRRWCACRAALRSRARAGPPGNAEVYREPAAAPRVGPELSPVEPLTSSPAWFVVAAVGSVVSFVLPR